MGREGYTEVNATNNNNNNNNNNSSMSIYSPRKSSITVVYI
jgi:hypothetical protein